MTGEEKYSRFFDIKKRDNGDMFYYLLGDAPQELMSNYLAWHLIMNQEFFGIFLEILQQWSMM